MGVKSKSRGTRVEQFPEARNTAGRRLKLCADGLMENDNNSQVGLYMQVGMTRVAQTETGVEVEMYRYGGQEDIMENEL